jgi:hypothetical protein
MKKFHKKDILGDYVFLDFTEEHDIIFYDRKTKNILCFDESATIYFDVFLLDIISKNFSINISKFKDLKEAISDDVVIFINHTEIINMWDKNKRAVIDFYLYVLNTLKNDSLNKNISNSDFICDYFLETYNDFVREYYNKYPSEYLYGLKRKIKNIEEKYLDFTCEYDKNNIPELLSINNNCIFGEMLYGDKKIKSYREYSFISHEYNPTHGHRNNPYLFFCAENNDVIYYQTMEEFNLCFSEFIHIFKHPILDYDYYNCVKLSDVFDLKDLKDQNVIDLITLLSHTNSNMFSILNKYESLEEILPETNDLIKVIKTKLFLSKYITDSTSSENVCS